MGKKFSIKWDKLFVHCINILLYLMGHKVRSKFNSSCYKGVKLKYDVLVIYFCIYLCTNTFAYVLISLHIC